MQRHAALIDASSLRGISHEDRIVVLETAYAYIGGTSKHNCFLLADLDFNDAPVQRLTLDEGCKRKQTQIGRNRNPRKSLTSAFKNFYTCANSSGLQVLLSAQAITKRPGSFVSVLLKLPLDPAGITAFLQLPNASASLELPDPASDFSAFSNTLRDHLGKLSEVLLKPLQIKGIGLILLAVDLSTPNSIISQNRKCCSMDLGQLQNQWQHPHLHQSGLILSADHQSAAVLALAASWAGRALAEAAAEAVAREVRLLKQEQQAPLTPVQLKEKLDRLAAAAQEVLLGRSSTQDQQDWQYALSAAAATAAKFARMELERMDADVITRLAHASVLLPDQPVAPQPHGDATQSSEPSTATAAAGSAATTAGRSKFSAAAVQKARIRQCLLVVMDLEHHMRPQDLSSARKYPLQVLDPMFWLLFALHGIIQVGSLTSRTTKPADMQDPDVRVAAKAQYVPAELAVDGCLQLLNQGLGNAEAWFVAEVLPGLAQRRRLAGLWQLLTKHRRLDRVEEGSSHVPASVSFNTEYQLEDPVVLAAKARRARAAEEKKRRKRAAALAALQSGEEGSASKNPLLANQTGFAQRQRIYLEGKAAQVSKPKSTQRSQQAGQEEITSKLDTSKAAAARATLTAAAVPGRAPDNRPHGRAVRPPLVVQPLRSKEVRPPQPQQEVQRKPSTPPLTVAAAAAAASDVETPDEEVAGRISDKSLMKRKNIVRPPPIKDKSNTALSNTLDQAAVEAQLAAFGLNMLLRQHLLPTIHFKMGSASRQRQALPILPALSLRRYPKQ
eukprot:gene11802-11947_t